MDILLKKALTVTCKHMNEYSKHDYFSWAHCKDCKLRHIIYNPSATVPRDYCFAIWHEGVLE